MIKIVTIVVSLIFLGLLIFFGTAEHLFRQSMAKGDVQLIRQAQRLNPFSSRYAYHEYRLTGDIDALRRAIILEPTRPAYHMYYGLAQFKLLKRTRQTDREGLKEICLAAELKPNSRQYQKTCEQFRKALGQ
jgi:hypothetical protein